jgi:PqqD family protein of HPr-rel-A system
MADRTNPISQLAVNDQGFIFDPDTGQSYTTNAQGRLIIQALGKDEPAQAIFDQILEMFQVSSQEAERDLEEFMDQLRCLGLVK